VACGCLYQQRHPSLELSTGAWQRVTGYDVEVVLFLLENNKDEHDNNNNDVNIIKI